MASAKHADRSPIDDRYLLGLVWSERVNIIIALVCAVTATCSNLASPVISGYLLEILAGRQPVELYPKVRIRRSTVYQWPPSQSPHNTLPGRGGSAVPALSVQLGKSSKLVSS